MEKQNGRSEKGSVTLYIYYKRKSDIKRERDEKIKIKIKSIWKLYKKQEKI